METVPMLMILYSSDAVEIRYSDGSHLELSPCGTTMIHYDALTKRHHPRHEISKKFQKRTMYVTSEFKSKVLQALDFRNRFAQRPYLCEELLPKEDVLLLYAQIDNIAWPKQAEDAKIEILPDGSRRITSLDSYASLVISPHGQDFTVCYLSKTSSEVRKNKDTMSTAANFQKSSSKTLLSTDESGQKQREASSRVSVVRPAEAVVHPFKVAPVPSKNALNTVNSISIPCDPVFISKVHAEMQDLQIGSTLKSDPNKSKDCDNKILQQNTLCNKANISSKNTVVSPGCTNEVSEILSENHAHLPDFSPRARTCRQSSDKVSNEHLDIDSSTQAYRHRPLVPFPINSPNAHELSSISRSSTPDGLRTTIDTDTTLTHDNTENSHGHPTAAFRLKDSPPAHYTSSPNENFGCQKPKKKNKSVDKNEESLSGSFLGNQKEATPSNEVLSSPNQCNDLEIKSLMNTSSHSNSSGTISADSLEVQRTIFENPQQLKNKAPKNRTGELTDIISPLDPSKLDFDSNEPADQSELEKLKEEMKCASQSYLTSNIQERCAAVIPGKDQVEEESQSRRHYIWTTKHASRNDCPKEWTLPLRIALEGKNLITEGSISSHPTLKRLQTAGTTWKANSKKCNLTPVPAPLPETCPFQHKHKWGPKVLGESKEESSAGEFQHGKLKVVISEGIVYRLIQCSQMTAIEVYPGDGSVLVSQGVKAHFFSHYILMGDQLEERTYSLKSLPPGKTKGFHSIEKLIKTANRFLHLNSQWASRGLKDDTPCWKKEVVAVVEPLSSTLLEECSVEGLGKFSAFTNGRVRIVFADRTALDMVCNFSRRVTECINHTPQIQTSLPYAKLVSPPVASLDSVFGASSARLLLPCGKYVTVDLNKPGAYIGYIQVAHEWVTWVNSTPHERRQFYSQQHAPGFLQLEAEHELKKIFCFNYILEQTLNVQKSNHEHADSAPSYHTLVTPYHTSSHLLPAGPHHQSAADNWSPFVSNVKVPHSETTTFLRGHHRVPSPNTSPMYPSHNSPRSMPHVAHPLTDSRKDIEIIQGFQSVRQVLLQNSSLINDIDSFLEKTK